ncbi:unnamed protein product, partial [Schistosoma turkestanicum]
MDKIPWLPYTTVRRNNHIVNVQTNTLFSLVSESWRRWMEIVRKEVEKRLNENE